MSNTESAQTSWQQVATTLGYPDEPTMWHGLYIIDGRKIGELSKTLGYGTATIQRRMKLCGIEVRQRGGANTPSRIAIAVWHLDPRYVRTAQPDEVAYIIDASVHSVYRILKGDY